MGYTESNPPLYVRPLLNSYESLEVLGCGYTKGSWVSIKDTDTGDSYYIERTITHEIQVKKNGVQVARIDPTITSSSFDNVSERDEFLGNEIKNQLCGFSAFSDALESI